MPNLVLAGGRGWKVDNVYDFLGRTANVDRTVKIVDKPSGAELEFLYRRCALTVFPSRLEGCGLPIGERLWFGKRVICAARSSMPEVAGSFANYFSHDEPPAKEAAGMHARISGRESVWVRGIGCPPHLHDGFETGNGFANSLDG